MDKRERKFFIDVSKLCNYADPELVRSIYLGINRAILRNLRSEGESLLPGWGKYKIRENKARQSIDVNTKERIFIPEMKTIVFRAGDNLRKYIKDML